MKVENIEYYSACPACGAAGKGKSFCEYCGTSLIKARTITEETKESIDERNLTEDAGLPVIEGKRAGKNAFLWIFCSIFGGTFLLVPSFICLVFLTMGMMEPWLILFFTLFWIIGIGALIPLIGNIYANIKCRDGCEVYGTVRGYENGNYTINGRPVQNMRVRIQTPEGTKLLILGTGETNRKYAPGQNLVMKNYKKYYKF